MDWFLYDNGLRHERVKGQFINETYSLTASIGSWNLKEAKMRRNNATLPPQKNIMRLTKVLKRF